MKNKLLIALATKIPVVATGESLEGLDAASEKHVLVAETPDEFANKIGFLLANPERADRLAAKGRELIVDQYSWSTYGAMLGQALARIAAKPRDRAIATIGGRL